MLPTLTRKNQLQECDIHQILSNPRRRETLRALNRMTDTVSLRELSELIASIESGETPAPRNVRDAVYVSLHQTHLPKLDELGVLEYDADRKSVALLEGVRDVNIYMEVVTAHGITWAEYYRGMGVLGLFTVVSSLAGVPGLALVDPLLWASGFLAIFAGSTTYQLWKSRFALLRNLKR
ncbi:DUF7344 domain-containing protein [Haloarchaeobius sp. TZWWS8]|uniref:DUF7344 domain-containing protein n=1 Tax=Haloarchaeobius sp. TZWWS8 TaxID=3446121 RepID=UPI003EBC9E5C